MQSEDATQSRGMAVFNDKGNAVIQDTDSQTNGRSVLMARNGASGAGPGAGFIFNKEGSSVVSMEGANDKQFAHFSTSGFQLMNTSDAVVVNLGHDEYGGLMNLCNISGSSVVETGSVSANRGLVRVYPAAPYLAVPVPTFIQGQETKVTKVPEGPTPAVFGSGKSQLEA